MENKKEITNISTPIEALVTLVFVILKLTHIIDWS